MAPPPGILEVRCAGCGETLEVEHGLTEFACPDCGMPQALPPELMPPRPRRALPLPRRGAPSATAAAPVCIACGGCGAVLSVPHGVGRFSCPRCGAELAASPAAAISVVAPPAAVPITSNRPPKPSEVQSGPSSQPARAGKVQKCIHSEQTHGQHPKHSFRDESFSSFRADTRTQIPVVGRLQNEPANSSVHREESHTELLDVTIAKPGKKKSGFAVGPKSCQAGKVHEEHPNQVIHASQAQGMPSNSSVHTDQAEGRFPDDTNTMHTKQKTGHVAAPSVIKHEQINSSVYEQLAGEFPSDVVHSGQVQVDFACKAMGNNKKSAKDNKGNKKRKNKSLKNPSNERSHLRRSKRLAKGSPVLIDTESIQKLDASPNQNHSEAPQIERTISDPDPSSPTRNRCPQAGSNELDNVDATTPPTLNHGTLQTEQFPHCYSQMYSPETRGALPNPSSNSWHEHETHQESFDGIDQLDRSDEEVHSNPSENQNKHIDGQVAQEACTSKNHSEQVWLNPHSNYIAKKGRQQKNRFIGSSSNDADHPGDWSFSGTHHQINMAASCRHSAALLPVPIASTLPTITSPSSLEKLPLNCISPTELHHQPRPPLYSQDARCGDMLSGSVSESSKKRRGRAPAVLMEPRKEVDRPVLTPNGTDNWNVHPPCPKLATTLSLLIKQNYPGTYVSVDTNGKPCELVVYHWHQCPSDVKATVLDEFLKRYKWPPGHEEECQKIFDRKAVRQLVNLFCYEKQTVREELAAKKAKRSSAVGRASGEMAFEEEDGREDSEDQQRDESLVVLEHDDPLKWKPFVPEWMQPKWWEMLCDHWAKDEVMKVSYQKRKNRNAGNHPCNAAGSRSIAMHQQLMSIDNGRKLVSDFDPSTKIHSGKGQHLGKKALRTESTTYGHTEETRDTQLGPHLVKEQVGSWKRGRYYGAPSVSKKAQIDSLPKSSPGCFSKQGQQPMFTQEQVQQMINQALQGLNETWEKKFLYLEQNMRNMSSSRSIPVGAKGSLVAVAGDKQCQLSRQDTLDSVDGERDPAARDEGENQDEHEHWS